MKVDNLKSLNTDALAYMGDAVYEQFVREQLLTRGFVRVTNLHRMATKYVRAQAQAEIIRRIFEELTEDEQKLVKRARNHKYNSKAKNADPVTYKWATAFEALVGYYYLSGDVKKLHSVMARAMEIIDGKQV